MTEENKIEMKKGNINFGKNKLVGDLIKKKKNYDPKL